MINFNKDDFLKLSDKDRMIHIKPIDIPHLTAADFNYESPIKCIMDDIAKQMAVEFDNNVYKAIQRYNIDVDKDELVRALAYDRNQYNKGFKDGFKAGQKTRWVTSAPRDEGWYTVTFEGGQVDRCYYGWLHNHFCWKENDEDITEHVLAYLPDPEPYHDDEDGQQT